MFQNTGHIITFVGVCLALVSILVWIVSKLTVEKFPYMEVKNFVIMVFLFGGVSLTFIGDSYRKNTSKEVLLSYYEQNISYKELTPIEKKNISDSVLIINDMQENGEDISKYVPALKKYLKNYYLEQGVQAGNVQKSIDSFLQTRK